MTPSTSTVRADSLRSQLSTTVSAKTSESPRGITSGQP
jgi:hypothetical protein